MQLRAFGDLGTLKLICVGGLRSRSVCNDLITRGVTDFVAMSRPFICEPDLVAQMRADRTKQPMSVIL